MVVYRDGEPVTLCDRCFEKIVGGHVRTHRGDMLTPAHFHLGCVPKSLVGVRVDEPAA